MCVLFCPPPCCCVPIEFVPLMFLFLKAQIGERPQILSAAVKRSEILGS